MNKEEILELVQAGFAPELIELEFNIPLEKINKYINQEKKKMEAKESVPKDSNPKGTDSKEPSTKTINKKAKQSKVSKTTPPVQPAHKKNTLTKKSPSNKNLLDILRQNYQRLSLNQTTANSNNTQNSTYKIPTELEQDKVNQVIDNLKKQFDSVSKMLPTERKEKRIALGSMLNEFKTIIQIPKTIEQLKELQRIFNSPNLENLAVSHDDKINLKLAKARKTIIEELATAIEHAANQTSDINELLHLSKQLPSSERNTSHFYASAIKSKLDNRITQLRTAQTMYNIRNNVSPEIENVLRSIADNTFDLQTAREAISQEAQRRVDSAPNTIFALTKERQEKQVEIQIRTIISEQGHKYPIVNPGAAITNLMELFSERDKENSFAKVIENLTSQEKYEEAKELCSKYISRRSLDEEESSMSRRARQAYKGVVLIQIGNMITEQLQKPSNPEQDTIFMELLEEHLQKERLPLKQVVIGTTASGGKKITLDDIWYTNTKQK